MCSEHSPLLQAPEWLNSNTNCHFYLVRAVSLKILIPLALGKFVRLFSCIWMRQISASTHLSCWKSQCCHVNGWNLGGSHLTLPFFFFFFGPVEKLMTTIPGPAIDTEGKYPCSARPGAAALNKNKQIKGKADTWTIPPVSHHRSGEMELWDIQAALLFL